MKPGIERRLRKAWHVVRRRAGAGRFRPRRLTVQKARWAGDALSPVMLQIDDLTNAWHSAAGGSSWEPGGDWGGGFRLPGSTLEFLESGLFRDYPEIKATFFTVAGPISPYTHHQPFTTARSLDADEQSRDFFRSLVADPRYELAYHGFNHGTPGTTSSGFVQEFNGFTSVEAAVAQTRRGLEIFELATGSTPRGGKYGGWAYNDFAEDAINACGFMWWCRDWTPRDVSDVVDSEYYEPQFFGANLVVSLPTTVHGFFWDRRQIDLLLKHRQIIAITEHIAPVRPDGLVQTPNVYDDIDELHRLFRYLRGKHVWYATGTEIASYIATRERTIIHDVTATGFSIKLDGSVPQARLTLRIDASAICSAAEPLIEVIQPDGRTVAEDAFVFDQQNYRHLVTLPVIAGFYRVAPQAVLARSPERPRTVQRALR